MGRGRLAGVVVLALAFTLLAMPAARAATFEVSPGPNAIQNALNAAAAGDTLLIHAGTYNESVTVSKFGLHLQAYGDGPVIVDGGCAALTVIDVNANAVRIEGLRVRGGSYYEVDFSFVVGGVITGSTLRDTCDTLYGVNVFATNGGMSVTDNVTAGFGDAGIYIGGISTTGAKHVSVMGNRSLANNRGIIVEDIVAAANVEVSGNRTKANRAAGESVLNAGIFLHNADGVLVEGNLVRRNGDRGIELDANSSGNVVTNNTISGHAFDLSNLGSSNCFSGNIYATSNGPLPACL